MLKIVTKYTWKIKNFAKYLGQRELHLDVLSELFKNFKQEIVRREGEFTRELGATLFKDCRMKFRLAFESEGTANRITGAAR